MDKLNPNNQIRPDMDPHTEPLSFSSEQDRAYSPEPDPAPVREELLRDLDRYISENWIPSVPDASGDQVPAELPSIAAREEVRPADGHFPNQKEKLLPKSGGRHSVPAASLDDLISEVGKSFHEAFFELVDESGLTDVEVYKRANMDRKLFSKIRSNPAYHPKKSTVLALAVALRLDLPATEDLLARAEYALSPGSKSDVIVRYFIERKVYDINIINYALDEHGLPVLY